MAQWSETERCGGSRARRELEVTFDVLFKPKEALLSCRLEVHTLHRVVSEFLLEAKDCMLQEPASQQHQHLQKAGFKRLPQAYRSAFKDLQVGPMTQSNSVDQV